MNYFAHAMAFLGRPNFVAGTGVPDWLTIVDRRTRLRSKHVAAFLGDPDPCMAEVAGGVVQHIRDDAQFHATRAFAEVSLELTGRARDLLGGETGLRPAFLGHLLTELLLDATLAADNPARLAEYYRVMAEVDTRRVQAAVNRVAPQASRRLATFIGHFCRERILWDYLEDGTLLLRVNQVMYRLGLDWLPEQFAGLLPGARELVSQRKDALLEGIPTPTMDSHVDSDRRFSV